MVMAKMAPAIATGHPVVMWSDFRRLGRWAFPAMASQDRVSVVSRQRVNLACDSFLVHRLRIFPTPAPLFT